MTMQDDGAGLVEGERCKNDGVRLTEGGRDP
jgi:hypothetical protein